MVNLHSNLIASRASCSFYEPFRSQADEALEANEAIHFYAKNVHHVRQNLRSHHQTKPLHASLHCALTAKPAMDPRRERQPSQSLYSLHEDQDQGSSRNRLNTLQKNRPTAVFYLFTLSCRCFIVRQDYAFRIHPSTYFLNHFIVLVASYIVHSFVQWKTKSFVSIQEFYNVWKTLLQPRRPTVRPMNIH